MPADAKPWKKFLVDTLATISASFPAGLFNEVVIAGMTLGQSLYARFMAIWIDLFTARPYGIYRDFIFTRFKTAEASSLFKKIMTDVFSYVTFQVPVYMLILFCAGATLNQVIIASSTCALFSTVSGRPFGMILDWFRRLFGVPTSAEQAKIQKLTKINKN